MPLQTTVIGSYPKPDYLLIPDWFRLQSTALAHMGEFLQHQTEDTEDTVQRALEEVINDQIDLGIDVITDGEISRENYIHHFCRQLEGFDFENLQHRPIRNGATKLTMPGITQPIQLREGAAENIVKEWKRSQALSQRPVKMTIPGPMTIIGSTFNDYYSDVELLNKTLALAINEVLLSLAAAGCRYVQVDEPLLVRSPDVALKYGLDHLKICFKDVHIHKTVHLCCGYPEYLDQEGYMKAERSVYSKIAEQLDQCGLDAVSIEDAHQRNDLSLFGKFRQTSVILGSVKIASSQVESVDEIRTRLLAVLAHIPPERLVVAPDCGLGFLPKHILRQKLTNMVAAAKSLP